MAQLFQSRIALFEGTWEKYHAGTAFGVTGSDGSSFLQKAVNVTAALMANPDGYGLENLNGSMKYWGLFNRLSYASSPEVMLWRQYDVNLNGGHRWFRYTTGGAARGLTKDLVDAYLCIDGKPIGTSTLYKGDNNLVDVASRHARWMALMKQGMPTTA